MDNLVMLQNSFNKHGVKGININVIRVSCIYISILRGVIAIRRINQNNLQAGKIYDNALKNIKVFVKGGIKKTLMQIGSLICLLNTRLTSMHKIIISKIY